VAGNASGKNLPLRQVLPGARSRAVAGKARFYWVFAMARRLLEHDPEAAGFPSRASIMRAGTGSVRAAMGGAALPPGCQ